MNLEKAAVLRCALTVLILLLAALPPGSARAAERVALIIGNNDYSYAPKLNNAVNDAKGVAAALRQGGYQVIEAYDLTAAATDDVLDAFVGNLDGAAIGIVYYAGHGIQYQGTTYLVPIDVDLKDDRDLRRTVSAEYFLQDASQASELGLVILDACRDNPFLKRMAESIGATRSLTLGRGLSRVDDVPNKTLIAYATQAGNVALDGESAANSPYATALIKHLLTPGRDVRLVFSAVRDEVVRLTEGRQEPFIYGSLGADEIFLAPGGADRPSDEKPGIAALGIPDQAYSGAIDPEYLSWKEALSSASWRPLDEVALTGRGVFAALYRLLAAERQAGLDPGAAVQSAAGRAVSLRALDGGDVTAVQRALRQVNFYGGAVDGVAEPQTEAALASFALPETGSRAAALRTLVRLGELAATDDPGAELSGTWSGRYEYPDGRPGVDFTMNLVFSQGTIAGSVVEPNTFGDSTSNNLYANFTGAVNGDDIRWLKTYDGTGGVSHSVTYEGTLDRAGKSIAGRWTSGASGTFTLSRTEPVRDSRLAPR